MGRKCAACDDIQFKRRNSGCLASDGLFCIKIITGANVYNDGTLTLSINNDLQFESKKFKRNDEVIDQCFASVDSITVQNPTTDGWTGEIRVTKTTNGVIQGRTLYCNSGCTGVKSFIRKIVVDGNGDGVDQAPSRCL